ncbi:lysylphosphatidylglycerol synthase domain-containing protein [Aquabacterium sp.]|uniref:lysylphosphatidylglycerol synthase domain-containing protein n=1 Tax=Aquabacterium sp. TaxID=1872578 RepID=UPI002486ED55|nr:lysylphosphatidylglycerol synthase domain-containing protein [Aquabacterium sp.]MDI1259551.1 lysylphosphatidylglycerol synthase domain-containing protein [Aquabacterium sp.]
MKSATTAWAQMSSAGWWPVAKRILISAFTLGVITLIAWKARDIDWPAVGQALRSISPTTLATAGGFALLSYALYGSFEMFGWHYLNHPLPRWRMAGVATSSYAVNLNLGTLVGGVGFRYRLYARLGLKVHQVVKLVSLSMLINWLAYPLLLGVCLVFPVVALPSDWSLTSEALRWVGPLLCLVPLAYVAACFWSPRRRWTVRGQKVALPSGRMACLQLALSSANWLANAAAIHALMPEGVSYLAVVSCLMVSAVAGVLAHIPGGLGVLEGVFMALLGAQVPQAELIGALLAYRAVYYLGPLVLALLAYLSFEATHRRAAAAA